MKNVLTGCVLWLCALSAHAAGFQSLDIPGPGAKAIALAIWYPSEAAPVAQDMGTFSQVVAPNGTVAGNRLPLVVISHGNGGFKYSHYDTALAMANAGFIVVALTHPGDNYADQSDATDILQRPKHVVATIDYMLKEWMHSDRIDRSRIGLFGFSAGGFTALVSVGAQPDLRKIGMHCASHASHFVCKLMAQQRERAKTALKLAAPEMHDHRIHAAVIVAPALGFLFDAAVLRNVTVPIQLWRAEDDTILPHPFHAEHVRVSLVRPPEYHVVPNAGHFDFLAPCTGKLSAVAPQICVSPDGFDRAEFHKRFNASVIAYFKRML